jgi:hypothetical protein
MCGNGFAVVITGISSKRPIQYSRFGWSIARAVSECGRYHNEYRRTWRILNEF